jgi:hypothetical protein
MVLLHRKLPAHAVDCKQRLNLGSFKRHQRVLRNCMTVVVEPILTEEKLRSLLTEKHEQSCLDYKRSLNLALRRGIVELAKDGVFPIYRASRDDYDESVFPTGLPSAPAKTPSTPPAASTSTTPPPGSDTRRTYGPDHLGHQSKITKDRG